MKVPIATHTASYYSPNTGHLDLPKEGYIRIKKVLTVIPVSKSTWWAGVASGRFPKSFKLGPRTTVWKISDIRALIEAA